MHGSWHSDAGGACCSGESLLGPAAVAPQVRLGHVSLILLCLTCFALCSAGVLHIRPSCTSMHSFTSVLCHIPKLLLLLLLVLLLLLLLLLLGAEIIPSFARGLRRLPMNKQVPTCSFPRPLLLQ